MHTSALPLLRWEKSAEMGHSFYELYDLYQAAQEEFGLDSMPEAIVQKCRRAAEVQHTFLGRKADRSQDCLHKLLGILETDCIPVSSLFCSPCMVRNAVSKTFLICVHPVTSPCCYQ